MSFNRQTLQGFPYRLTDMYQQVAGDAVRVPVSAATSVPLSVRKFQLASTGDIETPTKGVHDAASGSLQPQEYHPSTVVSVKIVENKTPAKNCPNSTSVVRSPHQLLQTATDICHMVHMQPVSYHEVTNPLRFGSAVQHESTSVTASSSSSVRRPTRRVQRRTEIPSSSKQAMANTTRMTQKDDLPHTSSRDSILEMFSDELLQQRSQKSDSSTLSSVRTYSDNLQQTVVRPVAVKAQPSMQRFHPLMSSPPRVLSSTAVPSSAHLSPGQIALNVFQSASNSRTNETNFGSTKRSPGSSLPAVHNGPLSPPCNTDTWNPYLPVSQSASIAQPVRFGSPDRSPFVRRYPAVGASSSVAGQSSGMAFDAQYVQVPSWPMAHSIPVHSYQSQNYISPQRSIGSPQNYCSSMCPSLPSQSPPSKMLSYDVQSAKLVSLQHISPKQHTGIIPPPAKSVKSPPVYSSQHGSLGSPVSPHHVQLQNSTSDTQLADVTTLRQISSGFGSPVSSYCSRVPVLAEYPNYAVVCRGLPSKSNSAAITPSRAYCAQVPSTVFSSPHGCSTVSLTTTTLSGTDRFCLNSTVRPVLRNYRMRAPATSLIPSAPVQICPPQQPSTISNQKPISQQPKQNLSVLPPARQRQWRNTPSQNQVFYQQPSNTATLGSLRPPTSQECAPPPFTANVSPNKFFLQGSLDFDTYIGKMVSLPQKQTVVKSENSTLSAVKKSTTSVCAGLKRRLDRTCGLRQDQAVVNSEQSAVNMVKPSKQPPSSTCAGVKRKLDWNCGLPQDQTVANSEHSVSSAITEVPKPAKKSPSACAGMKRKPDSNDFQTEDSSKRRTENRFVDVFQESLYVKGLVDNADADSTENKRSADPQAQKKQSKVCIGYY